MITKLISVVEKLSVKLVDTVLFLLSFPERTTTENMEFLLNALIAQTIYLVVVQMKRKRIQEK